MKHWGISAVACLLVIGCSTTKPKALPTAGYTVTTNQTEVTILWRGQVITHGVSSNIEVVVSPDAQSVAWVVLQQKGIRQVDGNVEPIYWGTLRTAHAGQKPIQVVDTKSSRGFAFDYANFQDDEVGWCPRDLKWDSTARYLYFTTQPWVTRRLLWQVEPGSNVPRAISTIADYRLLKKFRGPDWVEAFETDYEHQDFGMGLCIRDWTTTYIYTPEEMAAEKYTRPERRRSIGRDWPRE